MEDALLKYYFEMDKKYEKYQPHLLKSNEMLFKINDTDKKSKNYKGIVRFC